MAIADSRVPNGIGILPLQHEDYDKQGFSVDLRGSIVALRITGRDDGDQGLGQWFYDPSTPGTLEGGNFWDTNRNMRNCPGWAFAWSTQLESGGSSGNNVATGGGSGRKSGGPQVARPNGNFGGPDGRYLPKPVLVPVNLGKAGKDPNAAKKNAAPPAPPPGQQGQPGVLRLGIGASATAQGFGGAGVGTGSGFATFSGVRTNFGGGGFFRFTPPPGFGSGRS
jgi:hypothetical protein